MKDKSNSVVCQKKKPFVAEFLISCGEAYTTVSCNDGIVLSNRLSRWARKSENKRTCFDAGWPWGKRKSRLPWLDGIQLRSPNIFFCTVVQCWQPNAKAKLRQVRSVTNSKTNVKEHVHMYQWQIVLTQSYDAKIWPAASYLDAGRRIKDRGRPVDLYIYRDRKPSQHVTVGLAWGSPQLFYFR